MTNTEKIAKSGTGWAITWVTAGLLIVGSVIAFTAGMKEPTIAVAVIAAQQEVFVDGAPQFVLQESEAPCMVPITIKDVHDGDTITADINLPWGVTLRNQHIRAYGYDAWEINRTRKTVGDITDEELLKGKEARKALVDFFNKNKPYVTPATGIPDKDTYGRTLALLWGIDQNGKMLPVSEYMIDNGHVRPARVKK